MIEKFRKIFVTSLFLLISAVFAYEGRSGMFLHENMHFHLDYDNNIDPEMPHQQRHSVAEDEEKLVVMSSFDLSCPVAIAMPVQYVNDLKPLDYSGLIWQPPKSR